MSLYSNVVYMFFWLEILATFSYNKCYLGYQAHIYNIFQIFYRQKFKFIYNF